MSNPTPEEPAATQRIIQSNPGDPNNIATRRSRVVSSQTIERQQRIRKDKLILLQQEELLKLKILVHQLQSNQKVATGPLGDTFTFFGVLPKELRELIWDFALPRGRLIEVFATQKNCVACACSDPGSCTLETPGEIIDREGWKSRNFLHFTCRESREVATKAYKYCFSTENILPPDHLKDDPCLLKYWTEKQTYKGRVPITATEGVRFQPGVDSIYLRYHYGNNDIFQLMHLNPRLYTTTNVKSLVVDEFRIIFYRDWMIAFEGYNNLPALFANLERLTIMREDLFEDANGNQIVGPWASTQNELGYPQEDLNEEGMAKIRTLPNCTTEFLENMDVVFEGLEERWDLPPYEIVSNEPLAPSNTVKIQNLYHVDVL